MMYPSSTDLLNWISTLEEVSYGILQDQPNDGDWYFIGYEHSGRALSGRSETFIAAIVNAKEKEN